ncbi:MAG TPA: pantoate--beta-alanine ligase [Planctomycetes bacterium]|nr:pantoate--beta-alanine ligase [Planctomycetota bacterium]
MQQLTSSQQLAEFSRGVDVGFIPTMGALHAGHVSLVECAKQNNPCVIASIYVNPLQFGQEIDLKTYPQTIDADLRLLTDLGVDAVYMPQYTDIYPEGDEVKQLSAGVNGLSFEGAARPGHFDGMLTVVYRLLQQVMPSHAYFGEKDAQQLCLVRQMVSELNLPVEIVGCTLVRDADGLALSSRNLRLSDTARTKALLLSSALQCAANSFRQGERDVQQLTVEMNEVLRDPQLKIAYCAIVNEKTFAELKEQVDVPSRVIIAAEVGGVHLLDNLLLVS